jgi:hypothetical protein
MSTPTLGEDDARFLDLVANMWSRCDGDPAYSEGIWALKLRAIAAAIRNGVAPPARFDGEKALAEFEK